MFLPGTDTGGTMKRLLVLLGSVGIAFGSACKTDPNGQGAGCASTVPDVVISARDNLTYDKPDIAVSRLQRICWENSGTMSHSVTALVTETKGTMVDTLWNVDGQLNPDLVVLASFNTVGDYPYHCRYHQASGMTGVIHVR